MIVTSEHKGRPRLLGVKMAGLGQQLVIALIIGPARVSLPTAMYVTVRHWLVTRHARRAGPLSWPVKILPPRATTAEWRVPGALQLLRSSRKVFTSTSYFRCLLVDLDMLACGSRVSSNCCQNTTGTRRHDQPDDDRPSVPVWTNINSDVFVRSIVYKRARENGWNHDPFTHFAPIDYSADRCVYLMLAKHGYERLRLCFNRISFTSTGFVWYCTKLARYVTKLPFVHGVTPDQIPRCAGVACLEPYTSLLRRASPV